jgi:DinB family protein
MTSIRTALWLSALLLTCGAAGHHRALAAGAPPRATTQAPALSAIASMVDREIGDAEKQIVGAADAMPEDRFGFSPESLAIAGADYKGVRTFATEVKHIAASNYAIWAPLTGEQIPDDYKGGDGPPNVKTKADILAFLKASFALGHKAAATLTLENMLRTVGNGKAPRLHSAEFGITHGFDHYGQLVEYLRMNGIVPPASR